ncbi:pyridoxal phosphate-dependent aminotransferase [Burkholderia glumae]|uniref:pyridoxal phosphate-dependent aminotransferase n=1 Tax=Burkholderia glumae TaxID=337 RepID=UPI002150A1DE|nr:pyridoxal phosphate-dependent aminotransferase [Burkholderia glumae]
MSYVQELRCTVPAGSGTNIGIYQRMSALAREEGAVNLAQGIPEAIFDPGWRQHALDVLSVSWQYTPTWGLPLLRDAVLRHHGLDDASACLITQGCTGALAAAMHALAGTGVRQIVALEPFYSYYPGIAQLAGCRFTPTRLLGPVDRLSIDWSDLEQKLAAGPAAFLVNSPHNPSGFVLAAEDWARIVRLCERFDAVMLVDDVYRAFSYTQPVPMPDAFPSIRSLWAGSVSKTLAGSGTRVGWLIGDRALVERAHVAHMHMSNCLPAHLQIAAARLLDALTSDVMQEIRQRYLRRRDRLTAALTARDFLCAHADGGHFVLAACDVPPDIDMDEYCVAFARRHGVAALPVGGFFMRDAPSWMRFSFAVSDDEMDLACQRITEMSVEKSYVSDI